MNYTQNALYGLSNKKWLSELIGIEKEKLRDVKGNFKVAPFQQEVNGKVREFYNPDRVHKLALKKLNKLLTQLDIPEYLTGGVAGRSYVTNVEVHRESNFAIIVDISNFFPSTDATRVFRFFKNDLSQPMDIAKILTELTTVEHEGKSFLPQGYPTSPILSYLAYRKMYDKLNRYAQSNNLKFTAYYDDFTFSSQNRISKRCKKDIVKIIKDYSLEVNKGKTKLTKIDFTKITGCVIVNNELKAPRKLQYETHSLYKKLKYYSYSDKNELEKDLRIFIGKLSAIKLVEKERKFPNFEKVIELSKEKLNNFPHLLNIGK